MAADGCADVPSLSQPAHKGSLCLYDFSNEILINIIKHIMHANSLLALALCSRRLYELTEPILYGEFEQTNDRSLPTFLRRILAQPDLASRTRLFTGTAPHDWDAEMDISNFTEEDWTRVRAAVHAASIGKAQAASWIEAAEQGIWDALAALLLSVTPNLEELNLDGWGWTSVVGDTPFIDAILERAVDFQNRAVPSPYAMSSLNDVSLTYWDTESGMQFNFLEPFLKLRSVITFQASAVSEDGGHEFENAEPSSLVFSATDLTLDRSTISHTDMVYRFKQFQNLERLYYKHGGALIGWANFEPPRMMAAIEHLKPCLKDLTIIVDDADLVGEEFENYPIGSLAGFQKLTSIDVTSSILIGEEPRSEDEHVISSESFPSHQRLVDSVPPTLEYLSLRNCKEHHVPHIFDLVTQKAAKTPLLEELNLHWKGVNYPDKPRELAPNKHPGFSEKEADDLILACEAADIELVVKYLRPKPKYVCWRVELTAEEAKQHASRFSGIQVIPTASQIFHYPYEGYEECCREHDCDPATGYSKVTGADSQPQLGIVIPRAVDY